MRRFPVVLALVLLTSAIACGPTGGSRSGRSNNRGGGGGDAAGDPNGGDTAGDPSGGDTAGDPSGGDTAGDPGVVANRPVIVDAHTDVTSLTDGGDVILTVVATSNVPVDWFSGNFLYPDGSYVWGGGSGVTFNETSPNVWQYQRTATISPWAPSGDYAFTNISVRNAANQTSDPWPGDLIVTVSNTTVAAPPVLLDVFTDVTSLTDGGDVALTVIASSTAPVTWFNGSFLYPDGSYIWGGGSGVTFTEASPGIWSYTRTATISAWGPSGNYTFTNISVENDGGAASDPWPSPVVVAVSNSAVAEVPVIIDAYTDVTTIVGSGTVALTVVATCNAPVDWLNASFLYPDGSYVWGGGSGVTFSETSPGIWEYTRRETIGAVAPRGNYAFTNLSVENAGGLRSAVWPSDLIVTVVP